MDAFHPGHVNYSNAQFPDHAHLNAPDYPLYSHPLVPHHLYHPVHDDMPRPSFFSYSPDVIKHRKRTSRSQRKVLEDAFRNNPKPSQYTRKLLIHQTGMERRAIQVWFQNRRAKEKKLAAKAAAASTGGVGDSAAKSDPTAAEVDDSDDDDDEDGQNSTEVPASPATGAAPAIKTDDDGSAPAAVATIATISTNHVATVNTAHANTSAPAHDDPVDQATPSPHTASTPAATTSGSSNSPRPSTNGPSSPPAMWGSTESTPALGAKAHLATEYAMRRESAPAPLGANFPRPPPFLSQPFLPVGEDNNNVAIWEGGTPPSPLSINDDILGLRRGSLPVFSTHNEMMGQTPGQLTGLTPDPNLRRMSLERSRQRLASHPYAHKVMTSGRHLQGLPHEHFATNGQSVRPSFLHSVTAPPDMHLPSSTQMSLDTSQHATAATITWDSGSASAADANFPSYVRPRRYGSCQIGMDTAPYRTRTEIVPGPLPAPGFSFGTAPTAISETDGDDDETNTGTSASLDDIHRFGSFASVASTTSSSTSAWYSDVPSNGIASTDELPASWHPDVRRASCPAPSFMYAFSGLQVSNEAPPTSLFNSSELVLALDVNKATAPRDGEPAISVEDPSPVAHETQMQAKMQGATVTGYPENVGYYPEQFPTQNSGYPDPFGYSSLTGYDLTSPSVDTTPTASSGASVPYQYHQ